MNLWTWFTGLFNKKPAAPVVVPTPVVSVTPVPVVQGKNMNVTTAQLAQISSLIPAQQAVNDINGILAAANCTTPARAAMFIGQMCIESDYFRTMSESPASYNGRPYIPYYGRTWIQLTWEANYESAGTAIGVDLVTNPDTALQYNVQICAWFWNNHNLNQFADANDCDGCTRAINGPAANQASLALRQKYYQRALLALS